MTTAGTGKDEAEARARLKAAAAAGATGIAELVSSLPLETRCPPFPLRQLGGFWLPEMILPGVAAAHSRFEPRPGDVFLASFPKSGTTWLKALAFATLNRAHLPPPSDPAHPLRLKSPHDCVSFFELPLALAGGEDVFAALPSPRLLATHLPYHLLAERVVTAAGSGCRVVYVCRDPKDALVSGWLFTKKVTAAKAAAAAAATVSGGEVAPPPPPLTYTIEEAFELFCEGRCVGGPQWLHALGYWEESRRRPEKVLFLRYEDMLSDPGSAVRKLAEFMGCPFSGEEEEEAAGVVDGVVELCSLESMRGAKGNRSGATAAFGIDNGAFFRKGAAGDWRNHLTAEMAARLDGAVAAALRGSGLAFGSSGGGAGDGMHE